MKRYQKLLIDLVERTSYAEAAKLLQTSTTSLYEWCNHHYKTPQFRSLVVISEYFRQPLPTLLMEADKSDAENEIIESLFLLDEQQKNKVVEFIRQLLQK